VELARQAAALGAHAVASIPPKKPWPQIVEYYKALAAAGAPVIVYYIPGVTGMTAGMPELRMLLDIPGVAGIKMSDWNIFLLRSVGLEYPEKVVYSGFDEMLVPGLLYGADGCIGTWANLLPDLYAKVYARVRAGGTDAVKPVMDEFTAFLAVAGTTALSIHLKS
jgi:dihydrodipicolinate synthase/N-acetylneuraminate lyase